MTDRQEKLRGILRDLNAAKDAMYEVQQRLEAEGFVRKSNTLMNMIYNIEEFQNSRG